MKYLIASLFFVIIIINDTQAKKLKILGTYIDSNGDTINCKFKIPTYKTKNDEYKIDLTKIQHKIKAKRIQDNRNVTLKPKTIRGYEFGYNYNHYFFKSIDKKINKSAKKIFLQSIIDGKINLYTFHKKVYLSFGGLNSPSSVSASSTINIRYNRYFIEKEEGQVYKYNKKFFKTILVDLIADCPNVKNSYGTSDYDYENLYRILIEYNDCKE